MHPGDCFYLFHIAMPKPKLAMLKQAINTTTKEAIMDWILWIFYLISLREKKSNSEFFWSVFFLIRIEYE